MRIRSPRKNLFITGPFLLAVFLLVSPNRQRALASTTPLFLPAVSYDSAGFASSVAAADVNGDGKPDVMVSSSVGVGVLLGNGDGTFQPVVTYDSGGRSTTSVAVEDLNGDGKADLAVTNFCASNNCIEAMVGIFATRFPRSNKN